MRRTVFCLLLFMLPAAVAAGPGSMMTDVPLRARAGVQRVFILEAGQRRIDFTTSFIVPGSDTLTIDGRALRRGDDYRIDTLKGSVTLIEPAVGGEKLVACYARYPFAFPPVFATRFPEGAPPGPEATEVATTPRPAERTERDPYRWRVSGSKTVGFSIGSDKDLGIDQSLKVTMVGKVAKDLEVKASLSDDDLPVQPEGNTEELKHLDRVYVQINSSNAGVQLGDYTASLGWSQFSAFQRELRGVNANVRFSGRSFFAGGGQTKGRFQTKNIRGREGIQGPYELIPARQFNGVIVLPGTELVYLDGRLLKRGSENDYWIDYNRGHLFFTERNTITEDSEIVVDYQTGEDGYERTTLTGGLTARHFGEAVQLRAAFFQESDDSDSPVRGNLSAEDREILEGAGADPERAVTDGVQQVDPGKGIYILVPADTVPEHFEYDPENGEYIVDFYRVGTGAGDYKPDGFTHRGEIKYVYAGPGSGDYAVGRPLPLPERNRLLTVGALAEKGGFYLDAEGNVSLYDRNIVSGLDEELQGNAIYVTAGLKELPLSRSKLSLLGEFSSLEDRFKSPDKPRGPYYYRNWNLEDVPLEGRESIGGALLKWENGERWNVNADYRYLLRDDLSARKGELQAAVGNPFSRGLRLNAFDSRTGGERDRTFVHGEGAFGFWHLVPRLAVEGERFRSMPASSPDSGRYYYQGVASLGGRNIGKFRGTVLYSLRHTDELADSGGVWLEARENDEVRVDAAYASGGRTVEVIYSHRRNTDLRTEETDWGDLGRVRYRDSWRSGGITTDVSYRMSSVEERRREKTVVFVGENRGDYDEEGNEVGKNRGDYTVLYIPSEEKEPIHAVEFSWNLSVGAGLRGLGTGPAVGGWLDRIRRNVSWDSFISIIEKSRTDDLIGLYLLSPSVLQADEQTLYGVNEFRQELGFFNAVRQVNMRLTATRRDELDNRSIEVSTERLSSEIRLRTEFVPYASFSFTLEGGMGRSDRRSDEALAQNYRVRSRFGSGTMNYRLRASTTFGLELGIEARTDGVSAAKQRSYFLRPAFNSSLGKHIYMNAILRLTYTDSEMDEQKPLFFLEEGLREDWNLIAQYRLARYISFGINYNGRREKDFRGVEKTVHDFKFETRAYF